MAKVQLTAEMGTGKTLMGIAVSFLLCPPLEPSPHHEKETVTLEKGGRKAALTFERILRGKVYVRKGYAVAYVEGHKFYFRNGKVTYMDNRIVGEYQRNGTGTINNKPFQLLSSGNGSEYTLVELRATA